MFWLNYDRCSAVVVWGEYWWHGPRHTDRCQPHEANHCCCCCNWCCEDEPNSSTSQQQRRGIRNRTRPATAEWVLLVLLLSAINQLQSPTARLESLVSCPVAKKTNTQFWLSSTLLELFTIWQKYAGLKCRVCNSQLFLVLISQSCYCQNTNVIRKIWAQWLSNLSLG